MGLAQTFGGRTSTRTRIQFERSLAARKRKEEAEKLKRGTNHVQDHIVKSSLCFAEFSLSVVSSILLEIGAYTSDEVVVVMQNVAKSLHQKIEGAKGSFVPGEKLLRILPAA
ncbi:MAG: hypothetical protein WCJ81_03920 [bacterium]